LSKIIAWFKSKNITAHSVAAAAVFLAGLYTKDEQFRDFVLTALKNHPVIIGDLTLLAGTILKYSHSSSAAGTVATAEAIVASPKAPSPAAVDAANVQKQ
jgi:hypothetical protein